MNKIIVLTVLLVTASAAIPSVAQERPWGGEFAAYIGEGHVGGKEGTYGKGAERGLSFEIRRFSHIGFMADVYKLNHSGSILNVNGTGDHWDIEGHEVHASASLVYHFSGTPLEPYVFGGAGTLRTSRQIRITADFKQFGGGFCLLGCSPTILPTRFEQVNISETNPAFHAGAGIRVPLAWGLSFRPEARLARAGNIYLAHAVFALSYGW